MKFCLKIDSKVISFFCKNAFKKLLIFSKEHIKLSPFPKLVSYLYLILSKSIFASIISFVKYFKKETKELLDEDLFCIRVARISSFLIKFNNKLNCLP